MKILVAVFCVLGCAMNPTSTAVAQSDLGSYDAGVDASPAPDWTLTVPRFAVSVSPGETATYGISVTANSTFSGTVSMSSSGAPAHTTTTFNPSSYTLSPNQEGVGTFKIKTTSRTAPGTYYVVVSSQHDTTKHDGTVTLTVQ
jgi:hypothetical protein